MANLAQQDITRDSLVLTRVSAASGGGLEDRFDPGDDVFLIVLNESGSTVTVTITATGEVIPNVDIADLVVSVPAGQERMIGPFPRTAFGDPTIGDKVNVAYSSVTLVTVAALRLVRNQA